MPDIAYVNGKWLPLASAKVSVEDRGFQFGDGVYELIRTYRGQPFRLHDHLARLAESAKKLEIPFTLSMAELERRVAFGCRKCGYADAKIYIQLTRGAAPRLHNFPANLKPTWVMTFRSLTPIDERVRAAGVSVCSVVDHRWGHCDIKSLNLIPNVMAREQAIQGGYFETIFVRDGKAVEGAGSNFFAVFGEQIVTPPEGPAVLSGITRDVVLALGSKEGLTMLERGIPLEKLRMADEIFLTGTTIEVLPVVKLDGKKIGNGRPGKQARLLQTLFQNSHSEDKGR